MFHHILVTLDGSERAEQAVPIAARIARATNGSIVLLRIVPPPPSSTWNWMEPAITMEQAIETDITAATEYLQTVARSDDLAGVKTHIEVLPGEPALSVFPVVHLYHCDLLVMCSQGTTGIKRWALGSVAQKVARHSPIPVLIVHEDTPLLSLQQEDSEPLRILVPLDGSPLAEQALTPAAQIGLALSHPLKTELHLLRVLSLPFLEERHPKEIVLAARKEAIAEAKSYLATFTQQWHDEHMPAGGDAHLRITSSVFLHLDIAGTLIQIAEQGEESAGAPQRQGYDLIAMATHGRGGLERWLIGSVTERVLEQSRIPLLIVRPQQ